MLNIYKAYLDFFNLLIVGMIYHHDKKNVKYLSDWLMPLKYYFKLQHQCVYEYLF